MMASNEKETLRALMLIMCHLFGRFPMRAVEKESEKELIKQSASVVFLPKMPEEVAEVLKRHNKQTLATYELYVKTYIDQHCPEADTTLPFTKVSVTPAKDSKPISLDAHLPPAKLRSPFVALSGQGDHFESISDLCSSVRDGVFLEKAVIPYLDMGDELATPLNAYLYDFYQHGQVQALATANRIRKGEVWFLLNDFSLVLATLVASIENFFKAGDNMDLDMSTVGAVADEMELEKDDSEEKPENEGDQGAKAVESTETSAAAAPSVTIKRTVKKKKVVDSWDDDDDASEGEEADGISETQAKATQASEGAMGDLAEKRLRKVLVMFNKLKEEFDGKFRKIFA